jgi:signal transduction histidine kinase/ActR/RegA family two-component response regulator
MVRWPTGLTVRIAVYTSIIIIWAVFATLATGERRDVWERAYLGASSASRLIALDLSRNLDVLELTLHGVNDGLAFPGLADLPLKARNQVLYGRVASAEFFANVSVLNEHGDLIVDSENLVPRPLNYADREYFNFLRDHAGPETHVSVPVLSRVGIGKAGIGWTIPVAIRLAKPDGPLVGVVVGGLRLTYVLRLYRQANIAANDSISLFRTNGTMMAQWPADSATISADVRSSPFFATLAQGAADWAVGRSQPEDPERYWVRSQVGKYPLMVTVGLSTAQLFDDWYWRIGSIGVTLLILSTIIVALTVRLTSELGRSMRIEASLRLMNDALEQASQAKSRFLAGMSHELRTPLNGILGYARLLRLGGGLNVTQASRVDAMLGAGTHLLQMINCVLDLSQIEAGRLELHTAEIDLPGLTSACVDLVRPTAEAKALTLDLAVQPDVPRYITIDATRLRQVLLNMLGNAVKFTTSGSVQLSVRRGLAVDAATLRFEVADTGPGISAEIRHRLFQEFERLDAGSVEGAGLGLALAVRLATLMGGSLGQVDNPGGGSVFWLELPLVAASATAPPAAAPVPDQPDAVSESASPRALSVLVVDDVAMNRDIAGAFLRSAGHKVSCADGGAAAVVAATSEDFDVVLMDVRMPEIDGLEATRRIRLLAGSRGRVPIVALTAQVFTEQVRECRAAGMNDHLAKPFTIDSLLDAVVRAADACGE